MKFKPPVSKNQELTATVTDLTYQGMGVVKVDGYTLFCDDALPGEEIRLHVLKVGKNYGYAKVIERLTTSKDRVESQGKAYSQTGIAPLQHLAYPAQLKFKQKQIQDLLKKAHLDDIEVAETIGMKDPFHYRNKAQVPVRGTKGDLKTGFFKRGSHNFLPLENFLIQDERIDEILKEVIKVLNAYELEPYDEERHSGMIRHLMIRIGHYSREAMVVIVTKNGRLPHDREIAEKIVAACPDVVSVMQNFNRDRTNVILGQKTKLLFGKDHIKDTLNGLEFEISAQSFYQVNPVQTEKLYQTAIRFANLTGEETAIDAYCGIGTISLSLAEKCRAVYGVEIVEAAIEDAKRNAELNELDNLRFEVGNAEDWMAKWKEKGIRPNVIMVDPPRKGLTESLIESATGMNPDRIVYVSCNPATLVRDIQSLMEKGYHVEGRIQPVDQFPQTAHVESVTLLQRDASRGEA